MRIDLDLYLIVNINYKLEIVNNDDGKESINKEKSKFVDSNTDV